MITFTETAALGASEGFHIERSYVVAGMIDPIAMHDPAVDAGLCGDDFADPTSGRIFEIACAFAETGTTTNPSLIRQYCEAAGLPIEAMQWRGILADALDADTDEIPALAARVAIWRDQWRRAQSLFREAESLVGEWVSPKKQPAGPSLKTGADLFHRNGRRRSA